MRNLCVDNTLFKHQGNASFLELFYGSYCASDDFMQKPFGLLFQGRDIGADFRFTPALKK